LVLAVAQEGRPVPLPAKSERGPMGEWPHGGQLETLPQCKGPSSGLRLRTRSFLLGVASAVQRIRRSVCINSAQSSRRHQPSYRPQQPRIGSGRVRGASAHDECAANPLCDMLPCQSTGPQCVMSYMSVTCPHLGPVTKALWCDVRRNASLLSRYLTAARFNTVGSTGIAWRPLSFGFYA
jgi:hypothetical protein